MLDAKQVKNIVPTGSLHYKFSYDEFHNRPDLVAKFVKRMEREIKSGKYTFTHIEERCAKNDRIELAEFRHNRNEQIRMKDRARKKEDRIQRRKERELKASIERIKKQDEARKVIEARNNEAKNKARIKQLAKKMKEHNAELAKKAAQNAKYKSKGSLNDCFDLPGGAE